VCLLLVVTWNVLLQHSRTYTLYLLNGGGAGQDPEDWWNTTITTSEKILYQSAVDPADIKGISFCSQMQGLVLVVRQGRTIRNAFSYLNQRATKQLRKAWLILQRRLQQS
jgi:xylulokinase